MNRPGPGDGQQRDATCDLKHLAPEGAGAAGSVRTCSAHGGEELGGCELGVERVRGRKSGVCACRAHRPGVHHDDPVGHGDGGKPVRHHEHGGRTGDIGHGVAQRRLVDRVELGGGLVESSRRRRRSGARAMATRCRSQPESLVPPLPATTPGRTPRYRPTAREPRWTPTVMASATGKKTRPVLSSPSPGGSTFSASLTRPGPHPTWTRGRRAGSDSASRSTSRVTAATSPCPKRKKRRKLANGLPSVHSK